MSERRVLAVPTTEDPSSSLNHRAKLSAEYLEKALKVVEKTMEDSDHKLRWDAAKWVAEMVMGKPKQEIEQAGGAEAEMARMLTMAYAEHLNTQAALPPHIEGGVVVLGGPPPEEPTVQEPPVIEMVERKPRKSPLWDDLPE